LDILSSSDFFIMTDQTTNGMATAGFILALLTLFLGWIPVLGWLIWLLGIIFSAIGLGNANRAGGTGKGLAIAGLVISLLGIIVKIFLFTVILAALGIGAGMLPGLLN
jgi:uncharacterized phage infection (PIP) family protein YhgE